MTGFFPPSSVPADAVADFALRLVRVPSPSGEEAGVARLVEEEMRALGYDVEVDSMGNVVGTIGNESAPCVLVDAHMDTVGVTEPDKWTHDPRGERAGDVLYGRGTMDMKGPLAAAVYGVGLLKEHLARGAWSFRRPSRRNLWRDPPSRTSRSGCAPTTRSLAKPPRSRSLAASAAGRR